MCDCQLIVDQHTDQPVEIVSGRHWLTYNEWILLDGFYLSGQINYAAVHTVSNAYGIKRGYMFIVGEQ